MLRSLTAAALVAASFVAAPALAATYSAKPATAPAAKRIIARDISWACAAGACSGRTEESRPLVLCQGLAKQAGRLESFAVDGRGFAPAELDKCNGAAKGGVPSALASN